MSGSHGHRDRHTLPPSIGAPSHQRPPRLPDPHAPVDERILAVCPWCTDSAHFAGLGGEVYVECTGCGARGPGKVSDVDAVDVLQRQAAASWNRVAGMRRKVAETIEKLGELAEALRP